MKAKNAFFILMLILSLSLSAANFTESKIEAGLGFGFFSSTDSQFSDIYARTLFLPQFWGEFMISARIAAWADLAYIGKDGFIADVSEEASIKRWQLGLGLACRPVLSDKIRLSLGAGLAWFSFTEEGLGMKNNDSAVGLKLKSALDHKLGHRLFLRLAAGYALVKKTVEDLELKLGGLEMTLGIGYGF